MAEPALEDLDLVIKTMATTIVDNAEYFAQLDAWSATATSVSPCAAASRSSSTDTTARTSRAWAPSSRRSVSRSRARSAASAGRSGARRSCGPGSRPATRPSSHGRRHRVLRAASAASPRGDARLGDKTLLDALVPASTASRRARRSSDGTDHGVAALQQAADVAARRRGHRRCSPSAGARHTRASEAAARSTPGRPPSA